MSEITSILDEIKNSKKDIEVFAPSIGDNISISPITLAQQSKIIETVSDNVNVTNNPILALLEFNSITFTILKNNIIHFNYISVQNKKHVINIIKEHAKIMRSRL